MISSPDSAFLCAESGDNCFFCKFLRLNLAEKTIFIIFAAERGEIGNLKHPEYAINA